MVRLSGTVARRETSISGNGDGRELNRALTNVVVNAIRHTCAEGHVNVRVGLTRSEPIPACAVPAAMARLPR